MNTVFSLFVTLTLTLGSGAIPACGIVEYTNPMFAGNIYVNANFTGTMDKIADVATICNTKVVCWEAQ